MYIKDLLLGDELTSEQKCTLTWQLHRLGLSQMRYFSMTCGEALQFIKNNARTCINMDDIYNVLWHHHIEEENV